MRKLLLFFFILITFLALPKDSLAAFSCSLENVPTVIRGETQYIENLVINGGLATNFGGRDYYNLDSTNRYWVVVSGSSYQGKIRAGIINDAILLTPVNGKITIPRFDGAGYQDPPLGEVTRFRAGELNFNVRRDGSDQNLCNASESMRINVTDPAGSLDTCSVNFTTDFSPQSPVTFNLVNLTGNDNDPRGLAFVSSDAQGNSLEGGHGDNNLCQTNKQLREGVSLTSSGSDWAPGYYTLLISETCNNFSLGGSYEPNAAKICKTPIILHIDPENGGVISEGQTSSFPNPFEKKDLPCSNDNCDQFTTALGVIGTNPADFVKWVLGFILSISGGIALLLIIASGYRIMTSQGNEEKLKEAKEQLTAAIVGLLFIIFSLVILQAITVDILHIPGFSK